jgi:D-alanyl-D-alanine carboxypeptidase/D-alanyl-D-alanine-endopeptidase (penicillin-binding protein 4)
VLAPGDAVDDDGAVDALYLVGAGDPSLNDVALKALAGRIADAGVTRIRGGLLADESLFDLRRGSYDSRYAPDGDIGGWLGALTWAHGRPDDTLGPAQEAADRLHLFLRGLGIKAGKRPVVQALPRADSALAVPLADVESLPMTRLAAITNQPSDNFYAEMLLTGLGARFGSAGTTPAGIKVVRSALSALGVRPTAMVDGSGLSRADRASPRQILSLLVAMDRAAPDVREAWLASLAVVGRSGTLEKRMRGTPAQDRCRGKTGTLRGVSALSGYCVTAEGRTIGFSFLENAVNPGAAKAIEDRMLARVAQLSGWVSP